MDLESLNLLLLLEPSWTVCVNGGEYVHLPSTEIKIRGSQLLLGAGRARKIVAVTPLTSKLIRLKARRRAQNGMDVLLFYAGERLPSSVELRRRRKRFQKTLASAAAEHYRQHVTHQILQSDRKAGVGGAYPRLLLGAKRAVIAVDPDEPLPVVNSLMRAAFQWSRVLKRDLTVVVPAARKQTIVSRLRILESLRNAWDWVEWDGQTLSPLSLDAPDIESHVYPWSCFSLGEQIDRVLAHAPEHLVCTPLFSGPGVSVRFRGIEVARIAPGQTEYPLGNDLGSVLETLAQQRCAGSRHPLAHAHEEAWLESNLIGQIGSVLPVRQDCIYPQVPSFTGEVRKIVDILTVTNSGRLVVMEIKAVADPDLPFQALDYWQAVERHRTAGDFEKGGYFQGVKLRSEPALLVMVAPLLAFHRTLDPVLGLFPSIVPVVKIGINQDWKRGIKVLRRQGAVG